MILIRTVEGLQDFVNFFNSLFPGIIFNMELSSGNFYVLRHWGLCNSKFQTTLFPKRTNILIVPHSQNLVEHLSLSQLLLVKRL